VPDRQGHGPRIVAGGASRALAEAVAARVAAPLARSSVTRFPDGEVRPAVAGVRDADVYVLQSTGPPVNDHLVELLLLLDACRRAGAARLTAIVPYLGYARQDRRGQPGQAVAARVVADAVAGAGADRLVLVDPHTTALEAVFTIPVETLTAVPTLVDALRPGLPAGAVVVAPDLGGAKLAEAYAARLGGPVAVVRKSRLSGEAVRAEAVVGEVKGRPVLIVDDMISTGATIEAAARIVLESDATPAITVAATHGLLVGDAGGRLAALALRRLLVTDSLDPRVTAGPLPERCSIAPLLADAIGRLHGGQPLDDLVVPA
jgi:ribose-phosphate pyrophosphokinase